MRVGVTLPNSGPSANAHALIQGAQHAERLGYDSLWVVDRLLYPVTPRNPYPGTPDGSLPEFYKQVLNPLESLTFAAAHTSRIALGTSILDIPFYHPVVLARRLTTLDVLSGGRLRVGFGLGWSEDEFQAVGASAKERGARADEFLQVLKTIWTTDRVAFQGKYFQVPPSIIGPKPAQKPHPPIYLAAYVSAALKRAATLANGWMPNGIPLEVIPQMLAQFHAMAEAVGRHPAELEVIVVASVHMTQSPREENRPVFTGSMEQVRADIRGFRDLGANEIIFELNLSSPIDDILVMMARLRGLVE
jgi:probable F420-dependent oxidoreductase